METFGQIVIYCQKVPLTLWLKIDFFSARKLTFFSFKYRYEERVTTSYLWVAMQPNKKQDRMTYKYTGIYLLCFFLLFLIKSTQECFRGKPATNRSLNNNGSLSPKTGYLPSMILCSHSPQKAKHCTSKAETKELTIKRPKWASACGWSWWSILLPRHSSKVWFRTVRQKKEIEVEFNNTSILKMML